MKKLIVLCGAAIMFMSAFIVCTDYIRKSDDDSQIPVSVQSYDIGEPIESTSEQDNVDINPSVSKQDNNMDASAIENEPEQRNDNYSIPVSEQNGNAGEPVSEQNYDVGEPVIEKCYDNPNNPVATQNYSVGEPNNE